MSEHDHSYDSYDDFHIFDDKKKVSLFPESNNIVYGKWIKTLKNNVLNCFDNGVSQYANELKNLKMQNNLTLSREAPDNVNIIIKYSLITQKDIKISTTDNIINAWLMLLTNVLWAYDNFDSISTNKLVLLHIGLKKGNDEVNRIIDYARVIGIDSLKKKHADKFIKKFDICKEYIKTWLLFIDNYVLPIFYEKISMKADDIWESFIKNPISTHHGYWDVSYSGSSLNNYQDNIVNIVMSNGRKIIYDRKELGAGKTCLYSCLSKLISNISGNKNNNITVLFTGPEHVRNTALVIARTANLHIAKLQKWEHKDKNGRLVRDTLIHTIQHSNKNKEPDPKLLNNDLDRFNILNKIKHIDLMVGDNKSIKIFLTNYINSIQGDTTKFILVIDEWVTDPDYDLISIGVNHHNINTIALSSGTAPNLDFIPNIKELLIPESGLFERKIHIIDPVIIPNIGVVNTFPDMEGIDSDDSDDEHDLNYEKITIPIRVVKPLGHLPKNVDDLDLFLRTKHFRYEIQRGMTLWTMAKLVIEMKECIRNYSNFWKDEVELLNPDIFFKKYGFSDKTSIMWINSILAIINKYVAISSKKNKYINWYNFFRNFSFTYQDGEINSFNFHQLVDKELVLGLTHNDSWDMIFGTLPNMTKNMGVIKEEEEQKEDKKVNDDNIDLDEFDKQLKKYFNTYEKMSKIQFNQKIVNKNDFDELDDISIPQFNYPKLSKYIIGTRKYFIDIDLKILYEKYDIKKLASILTKRAALSEDEENEEIIFNIDKYSILGITPCTSSGLNTTARDIFISSSILDKELNDNPTIKDVIDCDDRQAFGRVARQNHIGICAIHFENMDAIDRILSKNYELLTSKALEREFMIYKLKKDIAKCSDSMNKKILEDNLTNIYSGMDCTSYLTIEYNYGSFISQAENLYNDI